MNEPRRPSADRPRPRSRLAALGRGLVPVLGLGLVLSACAGSDPELESAVASALGQELAVADDEARCLTQALVQEVDVDDLRDRTVGATPSTELEEPAGSAEDPTGVVALAPSAAGRCVELEDRLIALVDHAGGRVEPGCVESGRLDTWPLVGVLLQPIDDVGPLDELPGQATVQLLDAVRDCVDRSTLARLAGLDDPDRLAAVLIADPFARSRLVADQDACVVEATLDALGVERLASIGVDLDHPDLFTVRAQFDDVDIATLVDAVSTCDLDRQLLRAISVTDEQIAPCILDAIEADRQSDLVAALYDGTRIVDDPGVSRQADRCASLAVAQRYPDSGTTGSAGDGPLGITALARPYLYLWPSSGRYEQACLPVGLASVTTGSRAGLLERAIEAAERGVLRNPVASAAERAYLADIGGVLTTCIRPWPRLLPWLWSAEVDPETFSCVRAEIDDDVLGAMMESHGPAVWEGDATARAALVTGLAAADEAVASCTTAEDLERWRVFAAAIIG